jgi:hypothetical protein
MKIKRALTALAATLLAAAAATTGYSPAASATGSRVDCTGSTDGSAWWLGCDSLNGATTVWYVDGVRISEATGHAVYSFSCTYGSLHTVTVNPGTFYASTWTGNCVEPQ